MAFASKQLHSGVEVLNFLRMFQGAAATFAEKDGQWSLWLPEFPEDEHPLTPASQIFFPVILRHDEQAFAIRFFYDCASGKVRYYTSAIPEEISRLPKFENAISELFRHALPVEPIRQRSLGRRDRKAPVDPPLRKRSASPSLAEPAEAAPAAPPAGPSARLDPAPAIRERGLSRPLPGPGRLPAAAVPSPAVPMLAPTPARVAVADLAVPQPVTREIRDWRFEIGPRARSVLISFLVTAGILALGALAANVYLRATEDPGVQHHRLQIEEMRLRAGR